MQDRRMNGVRNSEEINRAEQEIARLAECLKSRRVQRFSRERLLRLQTDLVLLVKQLGEVQRIVSLAMIQRERSEAAGAHVPVAHRTPERIENLDVNGRAPSVSKIFSGRANLNLPELNGHDTWLNGSIVQKRAHRSEV